MQSLHVCVYPESVIFYDAIMTLMSLSSCSALLYPCPHAHRSHFDLNQLKLTVMHEDINMKISNPNTKPSKTWAATAARKELSELTCEIFIIKAL